MRFEVADNAFDRLAETYDQVWSESPAGWHQRNAVWDTFARLFTPGERILDVGCGTGADAVFLEAAGIRVEGVDASAEMVRAATAKGVHARHLAVERLAELSHPERADTGRSQIYDGAISNFGALNCVPDLKAAASSLSQLIRPGGYLAICVMGAFCLWESVYFLAHREWARSVRRCRPGLLPTSLGVAVHYPTVKQIAHAFHPCFSLANWKGIGVAVPPSYVSGLSGKQMSAFAAIDARVASWPLLRALSDHRLLVFVRL